MCLRYLALFFNFDLYSKNVCLIVFNIDKAEYRLYNYISLLCLRLENVKIIHVIRKLFNTALHNIILSLIK